MYAHSFSAFAQPVTIIHPGEYLATGDDIIIATVLGSCIAVALKDGRAGIGGLNHCMLPGEEQERPARGRASPFATEDARYGMYAMELLVNDLLDLGCRKDRLTAKVFGGGSVLGRGKSSLGKVPKGNIDFAFEYLKAESIPVLSSDVGGYEARKILFFVRDGKVLLKRITGSLIAAIEREEESYGERIRAKEREAGTITFFDR